MSSITSYSKAPDEPHVHYAVLNWASWWRAWNVRLNPPAISDSHQRRAIQVIPREWLEMCQRLLSIDLVACFVVAFTPGFEVSTVPFFPSLTVKNGPEHLLVEYLGDDISHSEPLAQQAVLHVATSFTAAILHLLKPAHLDGGGWSEIFAAAVFEYLGHVLNIWGTWSQGRDHDAVVLALKTLLAKTPVDFVSLQQTLAKWAQENHIFRGEQAFNEFFDYICLNND
jgi:hypothetical protein